MFMFSRIHIMTLDQLSSKLLNAGGMWRKNHLEASALLSDQKKANFCPFSVLRSTSQ